MRSVQPAKPTITAFLRRLPDDRRIEIKKVRDVVRRNLPKGYEERVSAGFISYEIPLRRYPETYNGQPLAYAGLAAQKGHNALYLLGAYQDPTKAKWLAERFRQAGKRFDMGKSCLRFQRADDLDLEAVGAVIAGTPVDQFISQYEAVRARMGGKRAGSRSKKL
jgi:hypothetical protein